MLLSFLPNSACLHTHISTPRAKTHFLTHDGQSWNTGEGHPEPGPHIRWRAEELVLGPWDGKQKSEARSRFPAFHPIWISFRLTVLSPSLCPAPLGPFYSYTRREEEWEDLCTL